MRCLIFVYKRAEEAHCNFADAEDLADIAAWPLPPKGEQDAADAHEFSVIAGKRWYWYEKRGYTVSSLKEFRERTATDPQAECVMFAVLKQPNTSTVLGLALFRRTWCNHLSLDYLASNPKVIGQVGGVGLALTGFICGIAREIEANAIWLETTPSSASRYQKWFSLDDVRDLLFLQKKQIDEFLKMQHAAFKKAGLPSRPI